MMKLAVGVRDPGHLRALQAVQLREDPPLRHLTRHMARRAAEVVAGGSLYWVVGGAMLVRQRVTGIEPAYRPDGTACAALLLDPALVAVVPRPVKVFQGWRYLRAEDAPDDLAGGMRGGLAGGTPDGLAADMPDGLAADMPDGLAADMPDGLAADAGLPDALVRQLRELCLL